jgi:hypothetical protein
MSDDLPGELLEALGRVGFVRTASSHDTRGTFGFVRVGASNQLYLKIHWLSWDRWSVGLRWRRSREAGRMPWSPAPLRLDRLGPSTDENTVVLSQQDLVQQLPILLEEAILPLADAGDLGG